MLDNGVHEPSNGQQRQTEKKHDASGDPAKREEGLFSKIEKLWEPAPCWDSEEVGQFDDDYD